METKSTFWKYPLRILKNKYLITLVVFVVYILFFDQNSLIKRAQAARDISDLKKEIQYYRSAIMTDKAKIDALNSSLENLETFAREEYLMKRADEEIFIIKE